MSQNKETQERKQSHTSGVSLKGLDKSTYNYYRFLYQNQNHALVRPTMFFGRKSYRWFRLTDTDFLLFSSKTSSKPLATIPLAQIIAEDSDPILKGFKSCIKLRFQKFPVYWLHFKNENEHFFFESLLPSFQKTVPNMVQIFVHNQTIETEHFDENLPRQQSIGQLDKENGERPNELHPNFEPLRNNYSKQNSGGNEENVTIEIAQEGRVHLNQLKVYQEVYTKPKRAWNEKKNVRQDSYYQSKNVSTNISDNEFGRDERPPKLPDEREKHNLRTNNTKKLQIMTNFPPTPSSMTGINDYSSKSILGKISFPLEKTPPPQDRAAFLFGNDTYKTMTINSPFSGTGVYLLGNDMDLERDNSEIEGRSSIRRMEFPAIIRKKTKKRSAKSFDKQLRTTKSHITMTRGVNEDIDLNDISLKESTSVIIGQSRRDEKVIGPRVYMNIKGPLLKDNSFEEPDGGDTNPAAAEENKDSAKETNGETNGEKNGENKKILYGLFNRKYNLKRTNKSEVKSQISCSLIDIRDETETKLKQITTIDECIEFGHKLMWNFELDDARRCLKIFQNKSLLADLMLIEVSFMKIGISGAEKKIKRAGEVLQVLYNKANNLNFSQKEDPENYFANELHKAEICIYRGAMHFFMGNKFQLIRTLAEGWRYYRKLEHLMEKKTFKEALSPTSLHRYRFGYGCFNLVFSLIPAGLLKFMKLIGILDPNKEKGLEALEQCRKDGNIRSNFASIILALYTIEFELALEKACDLMSDSLEDFPKCPLFHWITSIICWKYAQPKDAYFLIKTALWQLKSSAGQAIYLIYELGWYHFIEMRWENSLQIFQKIICHALPRQFFKQQVAETTSLAKSLKLALAINFSNFDEGLNSIKEERTSILPFIPHISVKIAACHFHLGNYELAIKWLLSAHVIYKNYSHFKSKQEEDFSKLAVKFLGRCSMKLLAFEVIYLMKYLPKLPDQNLMAILEQVELYQNSLSLDVFQLESYLASNSKEDPFIIEFFSATMVRIVCYCLMGDTDIACEIYKNCSKFLPLLPEDSGYMVYHIEYWVGRALVSEERPEEAKALLKALLKRKKCEFSLNTRIRKILSEIKD